LIAPVPQKGPFGLPLRPFGIHLANRQLAFGTHSASFGFPLALFWFHFGALLNHSSVFVSTPETPKNMQQINLPRPNPPA
jgi:hypothetical protein